VATLIAGAVVASCSSSSTPSAKSTASPVPSTLGSPSPFSPRRSYPTLADVPFYRVDARGQLIEPGPAPSVEPGLVWSDAIGTTHWGAILVDGELITTAVSTGTVVALDARSGSQRWQFQVKSNGPGANGAAAAADGLVFVSDPTTVYALDGATGKQRWMAPVPNEYQRLVVVDGVAYVGMDGGAEGLDGRTGSVVWRWNGPADVGFTVGLVADGVAYASSLGDGRLYAINLSDGHEAWHVQTIGSVVSSSEIVGDTVLTGTVQQDTRPVGELYAVDRATGTVRWRFRTPMGAQILPGPVRDGVLYAASRGDGMYAVRDDGGVGTQVWHVNAPSSSVPISMAGETLYQQRQDGSIGAYSAADGHLVWQTDPSGGDGGGPPLVSGGMIFAVNDNQGVLAFADP
jgi:outer membrane protein assembly factor BamB